MNLDQFNVRLKQRDHKLGKRAKLGKMNRLTSEPKVKKVLNRMNIKREWLDRVEDVSN